MSQYPDPRVSIVPAETFLVPAANGRVVRVPPNDEIPILMEALVEARAKLCELHLPEKKRAPKWKMYDTAITAFYNYLRWRGEFFPTKAVIERWRDEMLHGEVPRVYQEDDFTGALTGSDYTPYNFSTIKQRLVAVKSLLREASDFVDRRRFRDLKEDLRDWSEARHLTPKQIQDHLEDSDGGIRMTEEEMQTWLDSLDLSTIIGLRNRAIYCIQLGAGLRIAEVLALTIRDVFRTYTKEGYPGIRVRKGKGNKERIAILDKDSWVLEAVRAYLDDIGRNEYTHPDALVFVEFRRKDKQGPYRGGYYMLEGGGIREQVARHHLRKYPLIRDGQEINLRTHDLRRTYARQNSKAGMKTEQLGKNLGHTNPEVTMKYIGYEDDFSERVPLTRRITLKKV